MSKGSIVTAEIEPRLKKEVDGILSELGLTPSETIRLLYRQIKIQRRIPFAAHRPNKLTAKTLAESKAAKNVRHFKTKLELYADLGL